MTEPMRMPWKQAWKVTGNREDRLHRIASVTRDDLWGEGGSTYERLTHVEGVTCCGIAGELRMPGVFGRMGRPRCIRCCAAAGVERGDGIPGNGEACGPMDAWQTSPEDERAERALAVLRAGAA